ncbi:MAG TPA: hydroxymethylbilane synthase [Spirochaetia bacterium]|nr:hydroxymethylbilane synthase [Spirochaetia bacterium]
MTLVVGSRTSQLARSQTGYVVSLLEKAFPSVRFDIRLYSTRGDRDIQTPLPQIGGKGLFTERLEQALRDTEIDFAVHSLKDLPVEESDGLVIGAILGRTDPADVLVTRDGTALTELPAGAVVGTSSLRRQAQLLAARPDIVPRSIRGNVETRVRKVTDGEYQAVVLAAAGLARLGLRELHAEQLDYRIMLPAPGQGALAVQCRAIDERTLALLAAVEDAELRRCVNAERRFLAALGAGCSSPVAALANPETRAGGSEVHLRGRVLSIDGSRSVEVEGTGSDPDELGNRLARDALAGGAAALVAAQITELPLSGRRVVVTRSADQAGELAALLAAQGAIPIVIPVIRTVPVSDMREFDRVAGELPDYDWVLFTSGNAVRIFFDHIVDLRGADDPVNLPPAAAVGTSTAAALEERGISPSFVPSDFTAQTLGRELPCRKGDRLLAVAAQGGTGDMERELIARGLEVDRIELYRTGSLPISEEARRDLSDGVDALLFASGSAVRALSSELGAEPDLLSRITGGKVCIGCIGPSTAVAAREAGFPVHVEAATHTAAGLVASLAEYYGAQNHEG